MKNAVTFDKMTRESEEESTSDIRVNGSYVGDIEQIASFEKRAIMGAMAKTVVGYRVCLVDSDEEPEFKSIAEARAYARTWIANNLATVVESAVARDALRAKLGKKPL